MWCCFYNPKSEIQNHVPQGTLTLLDATTTDAVVEGVTVLSVTGNAGMSADSLMVLQDPTNGSWHPERTYYKKGEFLEIREVNGNTLQLYTQLQDSYSSFMDLYSIDSVPCSVVGVKFIAGTEGVLEVRNGSAYLIDNTIPGEREIELLPAGNIFADFLNEIEGRGKCIVTAKDSFTVTRVCLKARDSADTGKVVEL